MSLSIRDVRLADGRVTNVHIEGSRIAEIGPKREADVELDGRGKALLPGLVNAHTHAAMVLLRGYADDMDLESWLMDRIWPAESKLTPDDVYWGTKLACLEMIRSGTTCFNDMYFHMDRAAQAVDEMGLRAVLSEGFIDLLDPQRGEEEFAKTREVIRSIVRRGCDRVAVALGPHAVYTVSAESLREMRRFAGETGHRIHIHVSETRTELDGASEDHGKTPVQLLDSLGVLGPDVVAAHCVWLEDEDVRTLAARGVHVAHCPISNMKLAVGRAMPLVALRQARVPISLGTDGAASNNSLDLFETMKVAALLHKHATGTPTVAAAREVFDMATRAGAAALGVDAGEVAVGKLADLILLDLRRPELTPTHDLVSNAVYASAGAAVDTVICDGRVIMEDRTVPGEGEILERAAKAAERLAGRA